MQCQCACLQCSYTHCNVPWPWPLCSHETQEHREQQAHEISLGKTPDLNVYFVKWNISIDSRIYNFFRVSGIKKERKNGRMEQECKRNDKKKKRKETETETVNGRLNKILTVYRCVHKFSVVLTSVCVCGVCCFIEIIEQRRKCRANQAHTHAHILHICANRDTLYIIYRKEKHTEPNEWVTIAGTNVNEKKGWRKKSLKEKANERMSDRASDWI